MENIFTAFGIIRWDSILTPLSIHKLIDKCNQGTLYGTYTDAYVFGIRVLRVRSINE